MKENLLFIPEAATHYATQVDRLYFALVAISALMTVIICLAIFVLAFRYRRRSPTDQGRFVVEAKWLEISWSILPLVVGLILFGWGTNLYLKTRTAPKNAIEISAVAKQWMWKFQHPSGKMEINELHIPNNRPVLVRMISQDVIHSLFFPVMRVKQDVLPMYYTTMWFEPSKTGKSHLFCTEYCGKDHSRMRGSLYVMEPAEYEAWASSAGAVAGGGGSAGPAGGGGDLVSRVAAGENLYKNLACAACHSADNNRCPRLEGLFGTKVKLTDGRTVLVDENYIRESILNPTAKIVQGYDPQMPPYTGRVSEEEIMSLVDYVKSLGKK